MRDGGLYCFMCGLPMIPSLKSAAKGEPAQLGRNPRAELFGLPFLKTSAVGMAVAQSADGETSNVIVPRGLGAVRF
jgi:hypothetical protein